VKKLLIVLFLVLISYSCSGTINALNSDTWFAISGDIGAPESRARHSAVWTGTEMIVWGGYHTNTKDPLNTGGIYNVNNQKWRPMSTDKAPIARYSPFALWTGDYMLIWGGFGFDGNLYDGGLYDPVGNTWIFKREMLSPLKHHITASNHCILKDNKDCAEVIFIIKNSDEIIKITYAVDSDTWVFDNIKPPPFPINVKNQRSYPINSNQFWYSYQPGITIYSYIYNIDENTWKNKGSFDVDDYFEIGYTFIYGDNIFVWAFTSLGNDNFKNIGYNYNISTPTYSKMPEWNKKLQIKYKDYSSEFILVGNKIVIWGGEGLNQTYYNDGVVFYIEKNQWASTSMRSSLEGRTCHSAVVAGSSLIIWGGENATKTFNNGAIYTP